MRTRSWSPKFQSNTLASIFLWLLVVWIISWSLIRGSAFCLKKYGPPKILTTFPLHRHKLVCRFMVRMNWWGDRHTNCNPLEEGQDKNYNQLISLLFTCKAFITWTCTHLCYTGQRWPFCNFLVHIHVICRYASKLQLWLSDFHFWQLVKKRLKFWSGQWNCGWEWPPWPRCSLISEVKLSFLDKRQGSYIHVR